MSYPFLVNAVALEGDASRTLAILTNRLMSAVRRANRDIERAEGVFEPNQPHPEDVLNFAQCRMVRAVRVLDSICVNNARRADGQWCKWRDSEEDVYELLGGQPAAQRLCPIETEAQPWDMWYTPIPQEEFDDWRAENIRGFTELMLRRAAAEAGN